MLILALIFIVAASSTYLVLAPSGGGAAVRLTAVAGRRRGAGTAGTRDALSQPFGQRVLAPLWDRFTAYLVRHAPGRVMKDAEARLGIAGHPMKAGRFLGLQVAMALGMALAGFLLGAPSLREQPALSALTVGGMAVLGLRLPGLWLSRQIADRQKAIARALPDVIDLLTVSVEAGLGLDGAMQKVAEKFPEPTAGEFREVLKAVRLGTPRADALRALVERTGLEEVRTFAAALIQAEQMGVPISRVLRAQSEAMRVRRRQKAQEQAMALPVKMLFPLILFIFPVIFIVVLGPMVIGFLDTFR